MHLTDKKIFYPALCMVSILLSACGGNSGGGGAAPGTTTVRSAYVANFGDNTISQYTIDVYGALTPNGVVPAGVNPSSVTVNPKRPNVYVANSGDNTISQYTIGAGGGLVKIGTIPVDTGGLGSFSVTVDPSTGNYAYSANSLSDDVSLFNIAANGALTLMSTIQAGSWPVSVVVDPKGLYVYVANQNSHNISEYSITNGALSPITQIAAGTNPVFVAVDPLGRYVYVANKGSGDISAYSITNGTGVLSPITCTGISIVCNGNNFVVAGTLPTSIAFDLAGLYAYVTNGGGVTQFTIDTNGALINPVTVTAGYTPQSVTVDTSGKYVYVANLNGGFSPSDGAISQYIIGTLGSLTGMIPQATVASGLQPYSITTAVSIQ